ncbi:MAG: NAD(P)-binding domain-containing protein [Gemmiger sp.]|uniref:NAD(P)-binding domain-containing protein n=1 Tax=Gemmiger sp. TaxID=2049027 RepID=UPI002A9184B7|nr:NAD(P)-binding domain-containing protein [Gemmiger sp.]MDY5204210.1 NAD(P)-binding domain-containing protein [Gemmiger sp.]
MKKIAILGCGQLGSIVADAVASGLLPDYALCAAMSRKLPDAEALCAKAGGVACATLKEVLAQKPDYVIETAAVQVAKESCLPAPIFSRLSKMVTS